MPKIEAPNSDLRLREICDASRHASRDSSSSVPDSSPFRVDANEGGDDERISIDRLEDSQRKTIPRSAKFVSIGLY